MKNRKRSKGKFVKGDNLEPLEPIDIPDIDDFDQALAAMERTSFGGRQLGKAAAILVDMFTDPDDFTVLTLSGAMTIAKQGLIICELIERKLVDVVVATGALLTHGLIEGMEKSHFKAPVMGDDEMYAKGMCRVYDTIELETSFDHLQQLVNENFHRLIPALDGKTPPSGSSDFHRRLGQIISERYPDERSIVAAAYRSEVPLYVPAFTDSELALDLFMKNVSDSENFMKSPFGKPAVPPFNPFVDLHEFAGRVHNHKGTLSIFTVGGGVPRNWGQQIAPLFDLMNLDDYPVEPKLYSRGVRICPEPDHWGGLSGCSYREGVSWAKFLPECEGGTYAEVKADATIVLPFLIKGVLQRIEKTKGQRKDRAEN
jgi:deoxyhypusine synthase